jgi:acyl-coenzyme A thioesterase 13
MHDAKVLDASIGPPSVSMPGAPQPAPSVVSSSTSSLYIGEPYRNLNGVMHGGAFGVIFDMLTTIALGAIARPGYWE